jgi:hypothetical protein
MGMTQEGVPSLTRQRVEARRAIVESTSGTVHSIGTAELLALCDLALQSLPAEPTQIQTGDTPRTDAVALDQREGITHPELHETYMAWTDYWALREVSRQLERELQAHQSGASSGSDTEAVGQTEDQGNLASASSGVIDQMTATSIHFRYGYLLRSVQNFVRDCDDGNGPSVERLRHALEQASVATPVTEMPEDDYFDRIDDTGREALPCSCSLCVCGNETEYGELCANCLAGEHQG